MATELWQRFCDEHQIIQSCAPLFNTVGNTVQTTPCGLDQRLLLRRSPEMEALIIQEVNKVLNDFRNGTEEYEGLIYMMFWHSAQQVIPLYIGKSEKYGKQGNNLSANIANIATNKGKFCRWGDGYAYHIGDLSAVVCPNHAPQKITQKYTKWARQLFVSFPDSQPVLKQPVYFWMTAWKTGSVGAWKDFGITCLTALEYQLIAIASNVFSDVLLNAEGVNRRL